SGTVNTTGPGVAWDGTALGGSSAGESTCVEGVNCDTYTLTVSGAAADWAGKVVDVRISWLVPTNDFDLYVHKGSNAGPIVADSTSGAPDTDEEATFDPSVDGTGVYTVHVVYFSVVGEEYHGTAKGMNKPTARTATYLDGGIDFSPSATTNPPSLAFSSLVLSNISVGKSTDKGVTFTKNPLGNVPGGAPIDDRQWQEFYGPSSVYLLYRTVAPAVTQIQRSDDGGLTYG